MLAPGLVPGDNPRDAVQQIRRSEDEFGGLGRWWFAAGDGEHADDEAARRGAEHYGAEGMILVGARFEDPSRLAEPRGSSGLLARESLPLLVEEVHIWEAGRWAPLDVPAGGVISRTSRPDWASQAADRMGLTRRDIARMTDDELDARAAEAVAVARSTPSTRDLHRPGGAMTDWSPERTAMHERILRRVMDRYRDVPRDHRAVMAGGLPGAGKTSTLAAAGLEQYMPINPDDMKDEIIAEGGASGIPGAERFSPLELSPAYHVESSYLADRLLELALAQGRNVVIDATMGASDAPLRRLAHLREAGYSTRGVFVDVPVEVSAQRAASRYREGMRLWARGEGSGGRPVPAELITGQRGDHPVGWTRNRAVFEHLAALGVFAGWDLYDNSGERPRLLHRSD